MRTYLLLRGHVSKKAECWINQRFPKEALINNEWSVPEKDLVSGESLHSSAWPHFDFYPRQATPAYRWSTPYILQSHLHRNQNEYGHLLQTSSPWKIQSPRDQSSTRNQAANRSNWNPAANHVHQECYQECPDFHRFLLHLFGIMLIQPPFLISPSMTRCAPNHRIASEESLCMVCPMLPATVTRVVVRKDAFT